MAFSISEQTQITEADNISKALVIIFESHEKTIDLLKNFIIDEINRSGIK